MCSEPITRGEPEAEKPLFHLRVCLRGHQSAISPTVEGVMETLREFPCAAEREFAIEMALREALANAIVHGCRNDAAHLVECALSCGASGELHIVVRDPGPGFDPASVPDPLKDENVRSTHGRGIYLITHLMDHVWFEHGGTEIHMVLEPARSFSTASALPVPSLHPQPHGEGNAGGRPACAVVGSAEDE